MKKKIVSLLIGAFLLLAASPPTYIEEPKDSFVLFSWRLYSSTSTVLHLKSEQKIRSLPKSTAVYGNWRWAKASEYGGSDGFYYGHLACGGVYLPSKFGVAHKTLPCGTRVQFQYGHYTITVPVIDRGPYCCGRSFDFTVRAARALHLPGIGTVRWRIVKGK